MIDYIEIKGYKSIKEAKISLNPINILIGGNGAGKSNFISFFKFLNQLYNQNLAQYVALNGGAEKILHGGIKEGGEISAKVEFNNGVNGYSFSIEQGDDSFIFLNENLHYSSDEGKDISFFEKEARIKSTDNFRAKYILKHLDSFRIYHFHDTGRNSPFSNTSHIENDIYFLYEEGQNLAAFLFHIQQENKKVYNRIVKIIQSIAPYFSDFYFQPNSNGFIRLQWKDKYNSLIYGVNNFSDGTIRFIALTTLFMQPNLPSSIIIDEPELGLHPFAIGKLAGMIQSASVKGCQVTLATQSTDLISHFEPEDILTVDLKNGESQFKRLENEELKLWLDEYSLDELWKQNIIHTGQPW
jgi:predicted ATPase